MNRNKHDGDQIRTRINSEGIIADLGYIESVARYVYEQGVEVQVHAWISEKNYEKIKPKYIESLIRTVLDQSSIASRLTVIATKYGAPHVDSIFAS